jgi:predicted permease
MAEMLFNAYLPLILWTGIGILTVRWLPVNLPRLLGRTLYWVGVPWEILALARQTDFSQAIALVPVVTIAAIGIGLLLAFLGLRLLQQQPSPLSRSEQGSFLIAAVIGNTGFVGLGLVPALIRPSALGWAVFYSVTQNIVGTYGLGVLLASYFGRPQALNAWWVQLRDVLTVPSLWAFVLGSLTRSLPLPVAAEVGLQAALWFVIPGAFLLMGMRLSQLQSWNSLRVGLLPALLKAIGLPLCVGLGTTLLGLSGDPQRAIVLMAGMPSAFAGLILAEEYDLDRTLIASSIALSTLLLLGTIPLWLLLFH